MSDTENTSNNSEELVSVSDSASNVDVQSLPEHINTKHSDAGAKSRAAASESQDAVRKSSRVTALSLKGRENRCIKLHTELVKCINEQNVVNDQFLENLDHATTEQVAEFVSHIDVVATDVTKIYDEYNELCENKNEIIETMYSQFVDDKNFVKEQINAREEAEQKEAQLLAEAEKAIEDAKHKLEEEMKLYNERMTRRRGQPQRAQIVHMRNSTISSAANQETPHGTEVQANYASSNEATSRVDSANTRKPVGMTTASNVASEPTVNGKMPTVVSNLDVIKQFADCLASSLGASKLPPNEPAFFSGDPLEYKDWELSFNSLIEGKGLSDMEKLHYLKRYVKGQAKECVSGYFLYQSGDAYQKAKEQLRARYGNVFDVARAFRAKLEQWPKIGNKDAEALQNYADFLKQCLAAKETVSELRILDDNQENEKMSRKLPDWLKLRWGRTLVEYKRAHSSYPDFKQFVTFVTDEAEIMTEPLLQYNSTTTQSQGQKPANPKAKVVHTHATTMEQSNNCLNCETDTHDTSECRRLLAKSYDDRVQFIRDKRLCFSCLLYGHRSKECTDKVRCKTCNRMHATILHREHEKSSQKEQKTDEKAQVDNNQSTLSDSENRINCKAVKSQGSGRLLSMVVPVYISAAVTGPEKLVYALLDTQSDACFVTTEIAEAIQAKAKKEKVTISTLHGETTKDVNKFCSLKIKGYKMNSSTTIDAYQQESIPYKREQIPASNHAEEYAHLKVIAHELPPALDIPVGLLLGINCSEALAPLESLLGNSGQPYAIKTMFGWTLCGGNISNSPTRTSLKVKVHDCPQMPLVANEFTGLHGDQKMSQDDLYFLKTLENGVTQRDDGYYQMPLPFKERPKLPNNRVLAEKRLEQIKRKFANSPEYRDKYTGFVEELIKAGQAEPVSTAKDEEKVGEVWYIPHFGVFHPQKKKLRVVFDASAKYQNLSLNSYLLTGPDHVNNLLGVLCRFRKEWIAVSCDIEKMFYNFFVDTADRNYLRFLWLDEKMNTVEYRMTVHLFGATSSPGVATFGLRTIAQQYADSLPQAVSFIKNDFYVDDGITSVASEEKALALINETRDICSNGNLRLHKFTSNSREVLSKLPLSEINKDLQNVDLFQDKLPTERTLGMEWCVDSDTFKFTNNLKEKPATRRGILSMISQIYDPLGLLAPFVLQGKMILQKACLENNTWDAEVNAGLRVQWIDWLKQLVNLEDMRISRCIKPKECVRITRTEIHHFSDACLGGYGACSYLRVIHSNNQVHVILLLGKSRVAPLKATTVPRLELQAALEAARQSAVLKREMQLPVNEHYYWTDSQIVLGYITNSSTRFHMFVTNRVEEILKETDVSMWNHIPGRLNPADLASRGLNLEKLQRSIWFSGPDFLKELDISKYQAECKFPIDKNDPEVKRAKKLITMKVDTDENRLNMVIKEASSWSRLVRAIANAKKMVSQRSFKRPETTVEDLNAAAQLIIKIDQAQSFATELKVLKKGESVSKRSKAAPLNPYIDSEGVLRIRSRAQKSTVLTFLEKNPILLDKGSHLSLLIARHYHERNHHQGRSYTLAAIRQAGYWLAGASSIVKSLLHKCVRCKYLRGKAAEQQMGLLPQERTEPSPPFTHVGIDTFGHFVVRERRTDIKRWGIVFTCMYSRAVHIELLDDLTTDSFLQALRCFQAVRGPVRTLFSDAGTNFMGARNVLEQELLNMQNSELKEFLAANKVEFKTNTPGASHQGGVWERMIQTIRSILNSMTARYASRLNTSALRTAFYEIAAMINSRPLSTDNLCTPDEIVITPNHLLTSKSAQLPPPPGNFNNEEIYGKHMYRKSQQVAEEFWKLWTTQYLKKIVLRPRWESKRLPVKIGDIVLIVDENTPRNMWKMGIIIKVKPGLDGLVRNIDIRLANANLNRLGKPTTPAVVLSRPIQKVVVVMSA